MDAGVAGVTRTSVGRREVPSRNRHLAAARTAERRTDVAPRQGTARPLAMTRQGDTYLIDRGYHPTVRSPGYEGYTLTILVGRKQRSLLQYFEPQHRPLMEKIPGIQAMRDKFK